MSFERDVLDPTLANEYASKLLGAATVGMSVQSCMFNFYPGRLCEYLSRLLMSRPNQSERPMNRRLRNDIHHLLGFAARGPSWPVGSPSGPRTCSSG